MPSDELLVDSGAALHHAITVLSGEGARVAVDLLPDPSASHRLATLTVTSFGVPTPAGIRAHRAVSLRASTVSPAGRVTVPATAIEALAAEGATFDRLSGVTAADQASHTALLVAGGTDSASLMHLGRALSRVVLTAAMERLAITVADGLTAGSGGRPAIRIDVGVFG